MHLPVEQEKISKNTVMKVSLYNTVTRPVEKHSCLHSILRKSTCYRKRNKIGSSNPGPWVELDLVEMRLRLPDEKLTMLYEELAFFKGRLRASKKTSALVWNCQALQHSGQERKYIQSPSLRTHPTKLPGTLLHGITMQ